MIFSMHSLSTLNEYDEHYEVPTDRKENLLAIAGLRYTGALFQYILLLITVAGLKDRSLWVCSIGVP